MLFLQSFKITPPNGPGR